MRKSIIPIEKRDWRYTFEVAEKLGVTEAYIRELCNIGQNNKSEGIIAQKVGKEWRIPVSEVNRKLGLEYDEETFKKELYIKDLESKVKAYEIKFQTMGSLIQSLTGLLGIH